MIRTLIFLLPLFLCGLTQAQTITFWTISLAPTFSPYIEETILLYEADHPGVEVVWRDLSMESLALELRAALRGGAVPDVVNLNVPLLLEAAERDGLLDLSGRVPEGRYFPNLLESLRLEGKLLALPWYVTPPVVMVNTELFEEAGLEPEIPLDTPERFLDAAATVRAVTGEYGFYPNLSGQGLLYRFFEAGLPVLSEDSTRARFSSPAHAALLTRYVELLEADAFPGEVLFKGARGATERYAAGKLGMLLTGPQVLTRLKESAPEVYAATRVAPYPLSEGGLLHAPLMALAVPLRSQHPEIALDFALFVTGDERQLTFSHLVPIFPSTREAAADPFFRTPPVGVDPEGAGRNVGVSRLENVRDLTLPLQGVSELFGALEREVNAALFGLKTPQEALEDAVRFWNAKL